MIYQEKIGLSLEEYREKAKRVQQRMAECDLDAILCYGDEGIYANIDYLTRYYPAFEVGGVLLGRTGDPLVLIGGESVEFAAMTPYGIDAVRACTAFGHPAGGVRGWLGVKFYTLVDLLDEISDGKPIKRIGLPDFSMFPYRLYRSLQEACPNAELVDCTDIMTNIRMEKTAGEIALIRRACEISEQAFTNGLGKITPEMTEYQLEGVFINEMLSLGGEFPAFPVMCYAGYHSRQGIGRNTHQPVGKNTMINVDFGCRYGGYSSAYDRPFVFGKMTDQMKREIDFMQDVHQKVVYEWVKPGTTSGEVYEKYYNYFLIHGYDAPPASASHGIGVMEGEPPTFRRNIPTVLKAGMTCAADHFFRSDEYGFRYEDVYLIGENGNEMFTNGNMGYIQL